MKLVAPLHDQISQTPRVKAKQWRHHARPSGLCPSDAGSSRPGRVNDIYHSRKPIETNRIRTAPLFQYDHAATGTTVRSKDDDETPRRSHARRTGRHSQFNIGGNLHLPAISRGQNSAVQINPCVAWSACLLSVRPIVTQQCRDIQGKCRSCKFVVPPPKVGQITAASSTMMVSASAISSSK